MPLLVVLCALAGPTDLKAQTSRGNYNFLDFQEKPYYFGITLGFNNASYRPFRSREFLTSSIRGIESASQPGFDLKIVTNLKLGQYFDLRLLPGLAFAGHTLLYDGDDNQNVSPIFAEIPFHVRYKSVPYKDMRLFVIAGMKYSFDVASNSRARGAEEQVKISPTDFAAEVGAGIQFFFPYFIFSPEFKMSHGIGNVLIYDNQLDRSTVLEKLLSRTFTISFHFEG